MQHRKGWLLVVPAFALAVCSCSDSRTAASACPDPSVSAGFELAPEVERILAACGHEAQMTASYLTYARALIAADDSLDAIVAPDIRLNDLEPAGFKGLEGLKAFRRARSAEMAYDRAVIQQARFPAPDITDMDVCTERRNPATGEQVAVLIHARDRWADGKVVERWHSFEMLPAGVCTAEPGSTERPQ